MIYTRSSLLVVTSVLVACYLISAPAQANQLDDLPVGYWQAVGTNTIDDWDSCPAPWCGYGFRMIIDAWCDGELIEGYGAAGGLMAGWCGGHGAYNNNDFYIFDLDTLTWNQIEAPYPFESLPCDNGCGPGRCCDSDGLMTEWGLAEPCAGHTYGHFVYSPKNNKLALMRHSCSDHIIGWDFNTDDWWTDGDVQPQGPQSHADKDSVYDILRNRGVSFTSNTSGQLCFSYYFDTNTVVNNGGTNVDAQYYSAGFDPIRDYFLVLPWSTTGRKWMYNGADFDCLSTSAEHRYDLKDNFSDDTYFGGGMVPGMEWDPILQKFVVWPCRKPGTAPTDVCTLTPPPGCTDYESCKTGTWTWATVAANGGGTPPIPGGGEPNSAYGRFRYVPSKNVYVYINGVDEPVWAYRLTSAPAAPGCIDGRDNDGDGQIDLADPGCEGPLDTTESNGSTSACSDGTDNDGDARVDYPDDPGCSDSGDTSELGTSECDDGIDNDGDGMTDAADSGCDDPAGSDESDCGDGVCEGAESPSTCPTDCGGVASGGACSDGIDNDGDGLTDYPADPDCAGPDANNEHTCFTDHAGSCSCDMPGRVLCYDFDDVTDILSGASGHPDAAWGEEVGSRMLSPSSGIADCDLNGNPADSDSECWELDSVTKLSGFSALKFEYMDKAAPDVTGSFRIPFSDDGSVEFSPPVSFEVSYAWRATSEVTLLTNPGNPGSYNTQNYKFSILGRGDDWADFTDLASSCTTEELVIQRDYRTPCGSVGCATGPVKGGPTAYHACGVFEFFGIHNDGCSPYSNRLQHGHHCYYPDGLTDPDGGGPCTNGGCYDDGMSAGSWYALKYRVDLDAWGTSPGNRVRVYVAKVDVDSNWVLLVDSDDAFPEGYNFRHLPICKGGANQGAPCSTDADCPDSVCHDERGYGKIWLTGYTSNRNFVAATGDGNIWYDRLIVSREPISIAEYSDGGPGPTEPPAPPQNLSVD
jgi:hypothetical protein